MLERDSPIESTAHQRRIIRFMEMAQQVVPDLPTIPSDEVLTLRARLILEAIETIEALGFRVAMVGGVPTPVRDREPSLVEICDGAADLSVVTIGTLIACGVADAALLKLVDENNLAKFGPGGHRREDGKWVKPADHKPPDIAGLLEQMRVCIEQLKVDRDGASELWRSVQK